MFHIPIYKVVSVTYMPTQAVWATQFCWHSDIETQNMQVSFRSSVRNNATVNSKKLVESDSGASGNKTSAKEKDILL